MIGFLRNRLFTATSMSFKNFQKRCFSATSVCRLTWHLEEAELNCNEWQWEELPEGFQLKLKYIDTNPDNVKCKGTMLGLHGTPGTHSDLLSMLHPFAEQGYRILIPIMPGLGISKSVYTGDEIMFTHSTEEKASLLMKFLDFLGVPQIDFAIGHCTGACTLTMLLTQTNLCRSALYLCPIPVSQPPRGYQPFKQVQFLIRLYDKNVLCRPLARFFMNKFCEKNGIVVPSKYVHHVMQTAEGIGYEFLPGLTTVLQKNRLLPLSLVYAANDTLVEENLSLEYAEMLGISSVYKEDENLLQNADWKRAICLNSEHHLPFEEKHREIIINEIDCLLDLSKKFIPAVNI